LFLRNFCLRLWKLIDLNGAVPIYIERERTKREKEREREGKKLHSHSKSVAIRNKPQEQSPSGLRMNHLRQDVKGGLPRPHPPKHHDES